MNVQRRRRDLLDVAAEVLTANPAASLGDVAAAAGIGRTTLHKHYPKRTDLLLAVGRDAVRRIAEGIAGIGLPASGAAPDAVETALRRLVEALIPLGAQINFLLRQPSLDADAELAAASTALDEPVEACVRHAQEVGVIRAGVAPWWVISTLYALTYSAWEGVAAGRLAPLDAPGLAFDTLVQGIGAAS